MTCHLNSFSLACPSAKSVETVGTSVTLLETVMAGNGRGRFLEFSVAVYYTAIENRIDFEWIRSTGCSLHNQEIIDATVRGIMRIPIS
jgi:hypothetical protein